jgi:hypothetical protein
MTIKKYIELNEDFDILEECELEFSEPDNKREARENIEWVLENIPTFEALAVVVRSYYGDTIDW